MKKIISLFKRDYDGTRQVYDEVVEGSEWVQSGEGKPFEKIDGTSCLYEDGILYKRYDRKVSKKSRRKKQDFTVDDFRPAPEGWVAAEGNPNFHTGHWPGWLPIGDGAEDQWHWEAYNACQADLVDGQTYELVGPKIQGNPHNYDSHLLISHDSRPLKAVPTEFHELKEWLTQNELEGVVWHHSDGRMVKIKRRDFGIEWPVTKR